MRVAINLLTDHPATPSGAHWGWVGMIPEFVKLLRDDEELHLLVSPRCRPLHEGYGPDVHYITYPWSNEKPPRRTLTEHLYSPFRLPLAKIDVFNTLIAPIVRVAPGLVIHFKTMHAFAEPKSIRPSARWYRQLSYPHTAKVADAIIINSQSLRREVEQYLDVDPAKLHLIPEAVDHGVFNVGDREAAWDHVTRAYGVTKPFVLFVSSLWQYKNCAGLLRAFALAKHRLGDRQLAVVGPGRDVDHVAELHALAEQLRIADDVVWVGGVPHEETAQFYRCADVFAYPSFNETFGLPLLEAMACGCPVVTSNISAMPETAGNGALFADPADPESIADVLVEACGPGRERLCKEGLERAAEFTWAKTAERTLDVYRDVYARTKSKRGR
jgi:glycosyltransferase involved in cell wall biosynthesis